MGHKEHWDSLREVIARSNRFLLTTHVFPEGDAIGSEVALGLYLRTLGKEVVVLNDSPPLDRYHFLTRHFPVLCWQDPGAWPDPGWVEVAICLDVSSWDYLGPIGRWLRAAGPMVVSIDHHQAQVPFGDLDIVVEEAAATGEILYRYLSAVGAEITPALAEALYSSILFDTWGFRLPNTSNESIALAAGLLKHGVNHRQVCVDLFETDTLPKLDLLRLALGSLQSDCEGRLAWLTVPEDLFRATGARFVDADGILDHLLGLRQVEICVMFRQQGSRGVKVSFRSKGRHNVGSLAATLGGGGRGTASGVLLPMDLSEAIDCVLPRLYNMLGHEAGLLQSGPEILVGAGTDWGSGPARDHPGAFSIALGGISHQDPVFGREEVLPPDLALG
jgi:bifunctional oligoribonuclease and PAP phosphatase NrnA